MSLRRLATVYRTARVLVAEGILCELPFGAGESRCGLVKEQNHYHLRWLWRIAFATDRLVADGSVFANPGDAIQL
jgi:hypothetical protein